VKQIKLTKDAAVLEQLDMVYTALGLVDSQTYASDGLHDYSYTPVYRLDTATHPSGTPSLPTSSEDFDYDPAGNRTDLFPSSPYDDNNRLTASGYTYDADGNLTSRPGGITYTYNARNRLAGFSEGTTTASYRYDPFGRRYRKTVNGTDTYFLWDGDALLAEYDGSGTRTVRYVSGPGYAPLQVAVNNGSTETIYDVYTDHLDTPRLLADQVGLIRWRSRQLAYGQTVVDEDPDGDSTNVTFNIRFPGQYYDAESGLHYNYYRYYDPSLGRYLNADPIGQDGGVNVYGYVDGNPMNKMDPKGLDSPGCDVPDWAKFKMEANLCFLECCAKHDKCYKEHECSCKSWPFNFPAPIFRLSPCVRCNDKALICMARCTTKWKPKPAPDKYFCGKCNKWFSDPLSPHMHHSTP